MQTNLSLKNKKIAVLLGGMSSEREVSLRSGAAVLSALKALGYDAVAIDVGSDVALQLSAQNIDVAYLALHGKYGEDGAIQGLLEIMKIPYTGSGLLASSVAMDKFLTKEFVAPRGVDCPRHEFFSGAASPELVASFAKACKLKFPVVLKPVCEGSSIGIEKIMTQSELAAGITRARQFDSRILVEEFILGREVTVTVLNGKALPIVEVVPKGGFYDFNSKYTKGMTEYLVPASLTTEMTEQLQAQALLAYDALECRGVARADFMIDAAGKSYFLEINTLPGMTETSLVPKSAAAAGMSFEALVEAILETASLKL